MKMKQPDLGKKIAELRKAKGFTQEELVEKCNLSVRTLQRIESGEVAPRSYTIKVIFAALDYKVYDSSPSRLGQLLKQVFELFNLKTNTMKKLSVLSVAIAATGFILLAVCLDSKAQSASKVKKVIEASGEDFVRWFNTGQVDSLLTLYRDDACLLTLGCGKEMIRDYYESQMKVYKFMEFNIISLSVCDSIAVEKGRWVISFNSGELLKGEYLTEWRQTGKKWRIVNDISNY